MNRNTYISTCYHHHLNDNKTYKPLKDNPLGNTIRTIKALIDNEIKNGKLNHDLGKKLYPPKTSRLGLFYILPKLHKSKFQSRPIISSINHPTSNISHFLNKQMLTSATNAKSHIKNSYELLEQLKKIKPTSTTTLITADIASLYTKIPQEEGATIVTNTVLTTLISLISINTFLKAF